MRRGRGRARRRGRPRDRRSRRASGRSDTSSATCASASSAGIIAEPAPGRPPRGAGPAAPRRAPSRRARDGVRPARRHLEPEVESGVARDQPEQVIEHGKPVATLAAPLPPESMRAWSAPAPRAVVRSIARTRRIAGLRLRRFRAGGQPPARAQLALDAVDPGAERAQALVDPLVASVDLADVADRRDALGARGSRSASPCRHGCRGSPSAGRRAWPGR